MGGALVQVKLRQRVAFAHLVARDVSLVFHLCPELKVLSANGLVALLRALEGFGCHLSQHCAGALDHLRVGLVLHEDAGPAAAVLRKYSRWGCSEASGSGQRRQQRYGRQTRHIIAVHIL